MLDFNKPMLALSGETIKDDKGSEITLGGVLCQQLAASSKGDALKLFTWAQKIYGKKTLDLDPSDETTLKDFIKNNENLTVLAKAQMLEVFEN